MGTLAAENYGVGLSALPLWDNAHDSVAHQCHDCRCRNLATAPVVCSLSAQDRPWLARIHPEIAPETRHAGDFLGFVYVETITHSFSIFGEVIANP